MKNLNKNNILWFLFFVAGFFTVIDFVFEVFFQGIILFKALSYISIVLSLVLHIIWTFSVSKWIFFICLTFFIWLIAEIIWVNYWSVFWEYFYWDKMVWTTIYWVPIFIPFFWILFIYTWYSISSLFIRWSWLKKNSIRTLLFLILLDILIVVSIDLFMDPIMVKNWYWHWVGGWSYFGVPIKNFIWWALVVLLSTWTFRTYEFIAKKSNTHTLTNAQIIPFIGYTSIFILFFLNAIILKLFILSIVWVFVMMPISVLSIVFFINRRGELFFNEVK